MSKKLLLKQALDSIVKSDEEQAMEVINKAEGQGLDLVELLSRGFSAGMRELGNRFGSGEVFLPELIFASEVMKKVSDLIESKLGTARDMNKGVMVIGTVEGDVHDIGKGIVAALVKSNGVKVHDLGREVPAAVFVEKAKEFKADFIGSSALLTTTMTVQKQIEDALIEAGIRDQVKTLVGGAPVTARWAEKIGADVYCEDASNTVNYIEKHTGGPKNEQDE